MDWEDKYLGKLEKELNDIRHQINRLEHKLTDTLDRSITRLFIINKERLNEYISLNQRIDNMSGKVDRAVQWTIKLTVGTFVAVCSLVIAVIIKLF